MFTGITVIILNFFNILQLLLFYILILFIYLFFNPYVTVQILLDISIIFLVFCIYVHSEKYKLGYIYSYYIDFFLLECEFVNNYKDLSLHNNKLNGLGSGYKNFFDLLNFLIHKTNKIHQTNKYSVVINSANVLIPMDSNLIFRQNPHLHIFNI